MYRTIDTSVWDDPWFAELDPDAKLFFLYLITNRRTNASGAYELTERQMVFETGLSPDGIHTVLLALSERVRWYPEERIIWVRNFYRYQCVNEKMRTSARSHVAELPASVRQEIGQAYPELVPAEDRVSKPSQTVPHSNKEVDKQNIEGEGEKPTDGFGASAPPKPKRATTMTECWEPTERDYAWALAEGYRGLAFEAETLKFRDHFIATGKPMKDWSASWRNWMRRSREFGPARASPSNGHAPQRPTTTDLILEAGRRVEERQRERERNHQDAGDVRRGLRAEDEGGRAQLGTVHRGLDDDAAGHPVDAVWRERGAVVAPARTVAPGTVRDS